MFKNAILAGLILASTSAIATPCDNVVDLDEGAVYQVSDNKAYKMALVDGEYLTTNEWVPLRRDGYEQSDKAKVIADANARLKRIRAGN